MKNLKFFSVLSLLAMLLIQCQDFETGPNNLEEEDFFSIEQAKVWYEWNYPDELELKSGEIENAQVLLRKDWKKSIAQHNEKYDVVETELLAEGTLGFALPDSYEKWLLTEDDSWIEPVKRLVIMKSKADGKIFAFVMIVAGDTEYIETKQDKLKDNFYLKKQNDFSGIVLFYEIDGTYNSGWQYKSGTLTGKIVPAESTNLQVNLKSAYICLETTIYTLYQECRYYPNYAQAEVVICDPPYWEVTGVYVECIPDEYLSGGGGSYIPPAENPCNCNICPVCGGCLSDELKSAAPPGDDEESTPGCVMCSCPEVIIDPSFKDTKAECVYNKLVTSNMMKDLLSEYFGSDIYHVTYKVEYWDTPGINSTVPSHGACKDNSDNTVTVRINSYYFDKVAPVATAKTILHETIHAYLFQEVNALGGLDNLENSTFENLFNYYQTYGYPYYQHDYISQYYIPKMASTLRKYDNYALGIEYYEALAWQGLGETYGWYIKTQEEKDALNAKVDEINSGNKNCN